MGDLVRVWNIGGRKGRCLLSLDPASNKLKGQHPPSLSRHAAGLLLPGGTPLSPLAPLSSSTCATNSLTLNQILENIIKTILFS